MAFTPLLPTFKETHSMRLTYSLKSLGFIRGKYGDVEIDDIEVGDELTEQQAIIVLLKLIEGQLDGIETNTS
jgi:hypothetical protein